MEYKPGSKSLYSDLGYIILGFLIEEASGMSLDRYSREFVFEPLGLADDIFYNRVGSGTVSKERFAPTEECPWRGRIIQGEVSDENCWALGGVAGHAGLFANIKGVLSLTSVLLEIWKGRAEHPHINRQDLLYILQKRTEIKDSSWALGFDTPSPERSSSGRYLSPESVGHLGFTGTSFWIDPVRELVVVLLTNRVHPVRDNDQIKKLRPGLHDLVIETLNQQKI